MPALPDRLASLPHGADAPQIYLRADRSLDYGRVMQVMGELSRAGLTKVALVTNEAQDQQ
jgi:biopolymer transport protein TolR